MQHQLTDSIWKPVVYASRALTETEGHYAQIEKEALACTWAAEKFSDYLFGKHFMMETDHKPLVSLLGNRILTIYHRGCFASVFIYLGSCTP